MKIIKKNLYIICASAFLAIAVAVSAVIILLNVDIKSADSTAIGHIYLGNSTTEERKVLIERGFNQWKRDVQNTGGYSITYQNKVYNLEISNYLDYNEGVTISEIKEGQSNNKIYLKPVDGVDFQKVQRDIQTALLGTARTIINWGDASNFSEEGFWGDVLSVAGGLYSSYQFDLYNYITNLSNDEGFSAKNASVLTVSLDVTGHEADALAISEGLTKVSHEVQKLSWEDGKAVYETVKEEYNGITVKANQTEGFSLLNYSNGNNLELTANQLSIVGTGLTAIAMQSNFTNIRRVDDKTNPSYAYDGVTDVKVFGSNGIEIPGKTTTLGIASKISFNNNHDLTFYNNDTFDYNIKVTYDEASKQLLFTLIGPEAVNDYTLSCEITEIDKSFSAVDQTNNYEMPTNDAEKLALVDTLTAKGFVNSTSDAEMATTLGVILTEGQELYTLHDDGKTGSIISYYKITNGATDDKKLAFKVTSQGAEPEKLFYVIVEVVAEEIL